MRWFASFIITTILTTVAVLLLWARDNAPLDIHEISDALTWLVPGPIAFFCTRFCAWLIFGCWVIIRIALTSILAYTTSATEGSPREHSTFGTSLRENALEWLANPARWWLSGFVPLLAVTLAVSGPIVFFFVHKPFVSVVWGLTSIFSSSVAATFAKPDRVDPLTPIVQDDPLDPSLVIPGEPAGAG